MKRVGMNEIKELYDRYGVKNNQQKVRSVLNRGNLNKRLNSDFSNIYGNSFVNHYGSNTPAEVKRM